MQTLIGAIIHFIMIYDLGGLVEFYRTLGSTSHIKYKVAINLYCLHVTTVLKPINMI